MALLVALAPMTRIPYTFASPVALPRISTVAAPARIPYRVARRSWNTHHSRKFARPRSRPACVHGHTDGPAPPAGPRQRRSFVVVGAIRSQRSHNKMLFVSGLFSLAASLPLKCTTTSFPTDLTGKSCDGLQPAGPAADAAACAAICCARGEAACSTWNFKHAGGGFPAQCYIGIATHCDTTISAQVRRRPARRAGDPAALAVPVERRQVLLDGRERAVEFDYIYPPGDVAAVMYGKIRTGSTSSAARAAAAARRAISSSTARRGSRRARSTISSTRATARTARRATTPTRT